MSASLINLVAALSAEAKPIVSRLHLERVHAERTFPIYRREHVRLAVCAPGKINAAAATAYLGALSSTLPGSTQSGTPSGAGPGVQKDTIWVNIGVAGHASRPVGEVLLACRITDAASGESWHLPIPRGEVFPTESLLTLDQPDLRYERDSMVDMEASGFYSAARRFSPIELVQVLKIISDNRENTARGLSAKQVRGLVQGALDPLEALLALLEKTARGLHQPLR